MKQSRCPGNLQSSPALPLLLPMSLAEDPTLAAIAFEAEEDEPPPRQVQKVGAFAKLHFPKVTKDFKRNLMLPTVLFSS